MKNFNVLLLLVIMIGLGGCAAKGINLAKVGDVKIQVKNTDNVAINNVYITQLENEVVIHADVKPTKPIRFFQPGHLSFDLYTASGENYFSLDVTRYSHEHMNSRRSALKHVSFWVRMPLNIPKGSLLKVAHHKKTSHKTVEIK